MKLHAEDLIRPQPLFRLCQLTPEKVRKLEDYFMNKKWYLPDWQRNRDYIDQLIAQIFGFNERSFSLPYEIGDDFSGLIVFKDIIIGDTCDLLIKIWDKDIWSKELVKQGKKLMDMVMESFELREMETRSPDPLIKKFARMFGFKIVGIGKEAFVWDGQSYDWYHLRRSR